MISSSVSWPSRSRASSQLNWTLAVRHLEEERFKNLTIRVKNMCWGERQIQSIIYDADFRNEEL